MDSILAIARAISCPTRLFILQLVGEAGRSVTEVARQTEIAPSTACHHLRVLLHAGLVERVKRGRERVYRWGLERVSLAWQRVPQRDADDTWFSGPPAPTDSTASG
jgi:DNA-binding transcriptional ArsR family regulator